MTDFARIPSPARVILLGMMGSGKSTVGRALAERTGWPFVDNDALVERATGRTARELLAEAGEHAMRDAESSALRSALSLEPPVIVATAAGTVLDADDRAAIRSGGRVVWLHAPAEVLARRAAGGAHRPWLEDDPRAWFASALVVRDGLYADLADIDLDTSLVRPEEVADAIVGSFAAGSIGS